MYSFLVNLAYALNFEINDRLWRNSLKRFLTSEHRKKYVPQASDFTAIYVCYLQVFTYVIYSYLRMLYTVIYVCYLQVFTYVIYRYLRMFFTVIYVCYIQVFTYVFYRYLRMLYTGIYVCFLQIFTYVTLVYTLAVEIYIARITLSDLIFFLGATM